MHFFYEKKRGVRKHTYVTFGHFIFFLIHLTHFRKVGLDLSQQRWNGDECAAQRLGAQHVPQLVDLRLIGVNARVLRGVRRVFQCSFVMLAAAVKFHTQRGRPHHLVVSFIAVFIRFSQRLLVQRTQLGEIDWRHDFNKDVQVSDGFFLTQLGKIRVHGRLVRGSGLVAGLGLVAGHDRSLYSLF